MKFHLAINLERMDDATDIRAVRDHTLKWYSRPTPLGLKLRGLLSTMRSK